LELEEALGFTGTGGNPGDATGEALGVEALLEDVLEAGVGKCCDPIPRFPAMLTR